MSYKPSDFFVGVIDFFAILMPGAILLFFAKTFTDALFKSTLFPPLNDKPQKWIAFVIGSYILGHIVSAIGGLLDGLSDKFSNPFFKGFRRLFQKLPPGKKTARHSPQAIPQGSSITPLEDYATYYATRLFPEKLKEPMVNKLGIISDYVQLHNDEAATQLERMKAISRLFRSLTVISFAFLIRVFCLNASWEVVFATVVFLLFAVFIYFYQRWKRKENICSFFIALQLDKMETKEKQESSPKKSVTKAS